MERQLKKLFYTVEGYDEAGNLIIKVPPMKKQLEMQAQVEKVDKRIHKEEEKEAAKPSLQQATEFDNLISELMETDAVYVQANRSTGRNLRVDWDKVDGAKNKGISNKPGKTAVGGDIKVKQPTTITVVGEGVL